MDPTRRPQTGETAGLCQPGAGTGRPGALTGSPRNSRSWQNEEGCLDRVSYPDRCTSACLHLWNPYVVVANERTVTHTYNRLRITIHIQKGTRTFFTDATLLLDLALDLFREQSFQPSLPPLIFFFPSTSLFSFCDSQSSSRGKPRPRSWAFLEVSSPKVPLSPPFSLKTGPWYLKPLNQIRAAHIATPDSENCRGADAYSNSLPTTLSSSQTLLCCICKKSSFKHNWKQKTTSKRAYTQLCTCT